MPARWRMCSLAREPRDMLGDLGGHGVAADRELAVFEHMNQAFSSSSFPSTRMSVVDGKDELENAWFKEVYLEHGKLPIRRHAVPPEIAEHVAWLASERNTYATGQV